MGVESKQVFISKPSNLATNLQITNYLVGHWPQIGRAEGLGVELCKEI